MSLNAAVDQMQAATARAGVLHGENIYTAHIAKAPASLTDGCDVTIDAYAATKPFGPCGWAPRPVPGGLRYPQVGDRCAVTFTDDGPWILTWQTQDTTPHEALELAAGAVSAAAIDWATMPAVEICRWQHFGLEYDANGGWRSGTGADSVFAASWERINDLSRLPARVGYTRQLRTVIVLYYIGSGSVTASSYIIKVAIGPTGTTIASGPISAPTINDIRTIEGPWDSAHPLLNTATSAYLIGRADWNGAVGSHSIYSVVIEGRYV